MQRLLSLCLSFLTVLAVALLTLGGANAQIAEEAIQDYRVDIIVNTDRTVDITETITVNAQGREIKRGIFRDIPVRYRRNDGMIVDLDLDVTGVRRDGGSEHYNTSQQGRYTRIRIGDADVMLEHGLHTYEISYRVQDSIGFFDDYDEIYWNATGNEWAFRIEEATVSVTLPDEAQIGDQYAVYTGAAGATGDAYELVSKTANSLVVRTTKALAPRQGMTVAVGWQKGVVPSPTKAEQSTALLLDNVPTLVLLIGNLALGGWFLFAWMRVGKDPEGGAIIPRYRPSKDLSPALASYITGMGQFKTGNQSAFMAALIDLAIKRRVVIDETGDDLVVRKESGGPWGDVGTDGLPAGEKALYSALFGGTSAVTFADMKHAKMATIMNAFSGAIETETNQVYFNRNLGYFLPGLAIAVVALIAFVYSSVALAAPYIFPIVELVGAALSVVVLTVLFAIFQAIRKKSSGPALKGAFLTVFFTIFLGVGFGVFVADEASFSLGFAFFRISSILLIILGILMIIFFSDWMKAPTRLGRKVMDEVEGLKLYMTVAVAEQAREAQVAGLPDLTPELYEDLLPYAIALGVEKDWSDVFEDKVFSQLPPERAYRPTWYRGTHFNPSRPAASLAGMTSSLGRDLSSAMTPPASSSSGSGGGGSSGGGGGGGGGGGW
ncbi:Predicted membrane protein [Cohaesibacter sp. ES.047]|uniref:DUF2207 domain-containing protein n=1 Tax=Cohaesibacter sp. ES.047 TaxID=1798205 RepID=UPI000BB92513|nr:DUF2207 domain-containing protein [Cohaesibacter sp. ES.047]SNY92475.1 Predicted membrane protein [Cohaesibacter sp. ES.047]